MQGVIFRTVNDSGSSTLVECTPLRSNRLTGTQSYYQKLWIDDGMKKAAYPSAPILCHLAWPVGVSVSMCSVSERNFTPRFFRSSRMVIRSSSCGPGDRASTGVDYIDYQ